MGHRSLFTLEWDDEVVQLTDNRKLGKSEKNNFNAHSIPASHHNRNGRPIRPLMQNLPYSLGKTKSSSLTSKLYSNTIIHTYKQNNLML